MGEGLPFCVGFGAGEARALVHPATARSPSNLKVVEELVQNVAADEADSQHPGHERHRIVLVDPRRALRRWVGGVPKTTPVARRKLDRK